MAKIWALSVTFQNFLISEKFAIVAITIISAILLLQLFEPFVPISRLRFGSEVSTLLRSYKLYTDNLLTYSLTHFYWNEDLQRTWCQEISPEGAHETESTSSHVTTQCSRREEGATPPLRLNWQQFTELSQRKIITVVVCCDAQSMSGFLS